MKLQAHLRPEFKSINPQQLVPALDIGEAFLTQPPAIIEWLEEQYPSPSLLPADKLDRSHVHALAALIGCDVHPVNNRRILEALRHRFGADETAINDWCSTWISAGFDGYETLLKAHGFDGRFSFGDTPTVADIYLVPQIESARRFKVDIERWPLLAEIERHCLELDAFVRAAPLAQPDAS